MWLLVLLSLFGLASAQTPACGSYTMNVGDTMTIESQDYPSKYPKDVSCTWDFTCSPSLSSIAFDCSAFELQNSNGCDKDYLLIRDGNMVLDNACAVRDVKDFVTTDNHLTLNFITNSDNTRKTGFSCTATCMAVTTTTTLAPTTTTTPAPTTTTTPGPIDCGTYTMDVGETLTIESERYPLKYPASVSCTWDITCNEAQSNIEFDCSDFVLQNSNGCTKDYLDISDGSGNIDTECADRDVGGIVTSDNKLILDFVTNADSTRKTGFSCTATCVAVTTTTQATTTTTTPAITTTTTTPPTTSSSTTTTTPAITTTTTTPTTTTTTPPITTTTTTTPTTSTSTTTTTTPVTTSTTTTPTTTTPPTTSSTTTTTPPTTTPGPLDCGSHTMEVGETVTIESNRHPLKYPKEHTCSWDITCTQALSVIEFDCTLFELQNSNGCTKDYLEISDDSGVINRNCAKDTPTGIVTSDNTLSLEFVTNADNTRKSGFSCAATCIGVTTTTTVTPTTSTSTTTTTTPPTTSSTTTTTPPTTTPGPLSCGAHTMEVGDVVTIESERYPLKYPADHTCSWDITCSDVNSVIEFECQSFELQNSNMCKKDYLTISDGIGELETSCAKNTPTGIVTSDNNLSLDFATNSDNTRKPGFSCTATCVGVTTTTPPTTTTTTTPTTTTTTTTPTTSTSTTTTTTPATTTTTTTPTTTTTTTTPTTTTTTTTTTTPTTSTSTTTTTTPVTTTTTTTPTTTTPPTTSSTTTTTPPTTTPGPLACGTYILEEGEEYTIESNRHPLKYPADLDCSWDLTCSQTSSRVSFDCSLFEVQNSNGCKKDVLTISDGNGFIQKNCAVNAPTGVMSSDNTLSLTFTTNSDDIRRSGFSCTAKCIGITTTTPETTSTSSTTTSSTTTTSTTTTSSTATSSTTSSSTTSTTTTTQGPDSTEDPADLDRLPCQCGVAPAPTGDPEPHNLLDNPWTVALLDSNGDHFCSGTIVNTLYILTARDCVSGKGTNFQIRANEHELGTGLPRAITRDPTSVQYNGDLALIRMDTAISLTAYDGVKPACLPTNNRNFVGDDARHSGYDHSKVLKNDGVWKTQSGDRLIFDPNADGKAYCNEDLGGPIVTEQDGKNFLAGIALDTDCSTVSQESAKVSNYYDWIMTNSNSGRFCER